VRPARHGLSPTGGTARRRAALAAQGTGDIMASRTAGAAGVLMNSHRSRLAALAIACSLAAVPITSSSADAEADPQEPEADVPAFALPPGAERVEPVDPEARPVAGEPVDEPMAPSAPALAEPSTVLPLEDLRAFVEVMDRIRSAYVEDVDDRTLFENAIRGMLESLDPHSAYLADTDYDDLQEATTGSFGGVGLEVSIVDGVVRVVTPLDDTPAERAGVLAGDVIVAIDGVPVELESLMPTVDAMRGEPGTDVELRVRREDVEEPIDFDLVRAVIEVASVDEEMLEPGFGYIRIAQFQDRTGRDVENALERLQAQHGSSLDGLVLDLRNNPGGVLQASVQVADAFLAGGRIVYTEGRLAGAETAYNATDRDLTDGAPIVVLVNEGSASAAEIVAGALQDHHRAVIMGTPSFGKGPVQPVLPLSQARAIKLPTALYFTPNGRSIQAQGIVPDITVERARINAAPSRERYREADLPGHLDTPEAAAEAAEAAAEEAVSALRSEDYQVAEALNLLKGLRLLSLRTND